MLTVARQNLLVARNRDDVSHSTGRTDELPGVSNQAAVSPLLLCSTLSYSGNSHFFPSKLLPDRTLRPWPGGVTLLFHIREVTGSHLIPENIYADWSLSSIPRYRQEKSGAVSRIRPRLHYPTFLSIHYALSFCGIQSGPNVICPVCKMYIKVRCKILSSLAVQKRIRKAQASL